MRILTLMRAVVLAFPFLPLGAQTRDPSRDALAAWVGVAHGSVSALLGHAKGIDLALAGVRRTHTMVRSNGYAIDYVLDLLPMAVVGTPRATSSSDPGGRCRNCALSGTDQTVSGVIQNDYLYLDMWDAAGQHVATSIYVQSSGCPGTQIAC